MSVTIDTFGFLYLFAGITIVAALVLAYNIVWSLETNAPTSAKMKRVSAFSIAAVVVFGTLTALTYLFAW